MTSCTNTKLRILEEKRIRETKEEAAKIAQCVQTYKDKLINELDLILLQQINQQTGSMSVRVNKDIYENSDANFKTTFPAAEIKDDNENISIDLKNVKTQADLTALNNLVNVNRVGYSSTRVDISAYLGEHIHKWAMKSPDRAVIIYDHKYKYSNYLPENNIHTSPLTQAYNSIRHKIRTGGLLGSALFATAIMCVSFATGFIGLGVLLLGLAVLTGLLAYLHYTRGPRNHFGTPVWNKATACGELLDVNANLKRSELIVRTEVQNDNTYSVDLKAKAFKVIKPENVNEIPPVNNSVSKVPSQSSKGLFACLPKCCPKGDDSQSKQVLRV